MKKLFIITGSVFGILVISLFLMAIFMPAKEPTFQDCAEFGICKEGTEIIIRGEKVIINKEYCIKENLHWKEGSKICSFY